jgi:hypothetical protein
MKPQLYRAAVCGVLLWGPISAQMQIKKISEPSGKTLDKALRASALIQPDSKPFTVKLTIRHAKDDSGTYDATVEETWISPSEWVRTVNAKGLSQKTVTNATGTHIVTMGDYFPEWLRSFVTALFTPVPDAELWDKLQLPLTHIELANGGGSNPCMRQEFNLGVAPAVQINFANVCFKDGLLEMVQSTDYNMAFANYQKFGKLKVARTLTEGIGRAQLTGTIDRLEAVGVVEQSVFAAADVASDKDPLSSYIVDTEQLTKLAGGAVALPWPHPIPGRGMFTVWVSLDRHGVVREVHTLNTDESGFAYDMAQRLLGLHWKAPLLNGAAVQVQGALVFAYPPEAVSTSTKSSPHE